MGRETRILLGLLGLLAGLFVGALSLKLLVPRPPMGAGPDVLGDVAFTVRQELVPPPVRGPRAADFAAAPPLVATGPAQIPLAAAVPGDVPAAIADPAGFMADQQPPPRFAVAGPTANLEPLDAAPATADPFVQRAAFADEQPARPEPAAGGSRFARPAFDDGGTESAFTAAPAGDEPLDAPSPAMSASRFGPGTGAGVGATSLDRGEPAASADPFPTDRVGVVIDAGASVAPPVNSPRQADPFARSQVPATLAPDVRQPLAAGPIAGGHVVAAGDSWWSLAERAYGDGRLYRALYAWNRARVPRVALVPGTSLEIPPVERLAASWPTLIPAGR